MDPHIYARIVDRILEVFQRQLPLQLFALPRIDRDNHASQLLRQRRQKHHIASAVKMKREFVLLRSVRSVDFHISEEEREPHALPLKRDSQLFANAAVRPKQPMTQRGLTSSSLPSRWRSVAMTLSFSCVSP